MPRKVAWRYQHPTSAHEVHPKYINRILNFLVEKLRPATGPSQLLHSQLQKPIITKWPSLRYVRAQIPSTNVLSILTDFFRVAEAEAAVEVVAVVVAVDGIPVRIVTAPISRKHTKKWSATTMNF